MTILGAPIGGRRRSLAREERARGYLLAAMRIVDRVGLDGLTMQALASEADAAVGTVYTYFPSKGALIAEMQREAIERLAASYALTRERSEPAIADWEGRPAAIARLAVFGSFWIDSPATLPHEAHLLHALVAASGQVVPDGERHRVLPAALGLLGEARLCVEAAADVGAIGVGDPMGVVVRWASALTGALLAANLASIDPAILDGPRLADDLQRDLLLGWGADPGDVARAEDHVAGLRAAGPLAPRP